MRGPCTVLPSSLRAFGSGALGQVTLSESPHSDTSTCPSHRTLKSTCLSYRTLTSSLVRVLSPCPNHRSHPSPLSVCPSPRFELSASQQGRGGHNPGSLGDQAGERHLPVRVVAGPRRAAGASRLSESPQIAARPGPPGREARGRPGARTD